MSKWHSGYLKSARQLPMLPLKKLAGYRKRKKPSWIFKFRYVAPVTDGTEAIPEDEFHTCGQFHMSMVFQTPHLLYRSYATVPKETLKKVKSSDIARVCLCW